MSKRDWMLATVLAVAVGLGCWLALPAGGHDWADSFGPAGRYWRSAPWQYVPYLPWAAVALAPLGSLSDRLATALVNAASVLVMVGVLRRLGGPAWLVIPLVLSPLAIQVFMLTQPDVLLLGGLLLPAGWDLLVLTIKPQVAAGAIFGRLRGVAQGGWRALARFLAPLTLVGVASFFIWPGWPLALLGRAQVHIAYSWNVAPWPWALPIGLVLLWQAWRQADVAYGVLATPLIVPYLNVQTLLAPLVILAARWPRWFWVAWVGSWGLAVYLVLGGRLSRDFLGLTILCFGILLIGRALYRRRQQRPAGEVAGSA